MAFASVPHRPLDRNLDVAAYPLAYVVHQSDDASQTLPRQVLVHEGARDVRDGVGGDVELQDRDAHLGIDVLEIQV